MDLFEALNKLNEDDESNIPHDVIKKACDFAYGFKQSVVDTNNRKIVIPYPSGMTVEDINSPGMLGAWFTEHGFNSEYEVRDFEYETKNGTNTFGGGWRPKKSYLRNRLVGTYTW
jgi:hypothetical protein